MPLKQMLESLNHCVIRMREIKQQTDRRSVKSIDTPIVSKPLTLTAKEGIDGL